MGTTEQGRRPESDQASGRPGGPGCIRLDERGWWLTRADVLVAAGTLLVAGGVAATTWFGVGRPRSANGPSDASAASPDASVATDGLDALVGYVDGASVTGAAGSVEADAASAGAAGAGLFAVIQNTRGFYEALPLDVDATRMVRSDLGENEVEVSGGAVRVSHSDCKNQVCVDAGWASWPGQVITCLPHQLVVQVVRDPADASRLS